MKLISSGVTGDALRPVSCYEISISQMITYYHFIQGKHVNGQEGRLNYSYLLISIPRRGPALFMH